MHRSRANDSLRILWLKTELLHPVDKGGRIRTYQMLRAIAREHRVTYLTLDDGKAAPDAIEKAKEYCDRIVCIPFSPPAKQSFEFAAALGRNLFSGHAYAVERYRSTAMSRAVQGLAPEHDFVVCDFLAPAINLPLTLPIPVVLFQHNVEAMIWQRHADVAKTALRRLYMQIQFRRMAKFERTICNAVTGVIAVSEADAREMQERYHAQSVAAVPTGVDLEYFRSNGVTVRRRAEIVFTGSMDWMPNDDAIQWFMTDILPLVQQRIPEAALTIVGRNPSEALIRLAERSGTVEITGRVPDVRPYLERASVFVVPMRVGGGTRLKIYEAMAMRVPIVATSIGAEGLPLTDGEHLILRDDAGSFADVLVELLQSPKASERLAGDAEALVRANFGWEGVAEEFVSKCRQLIERSAVSLPHSH